MEWTRVRQLLGSLSIGSGSIALWLAFQRQMCTAVGTVGAAENQCAPNIVYLVPGILAVLLGIGLIQLRFLTIVSGILAGGTILYGLIALLIWNESLAIGLLLLVIALLFAALALGAEALRAYRGQRQDCPISIGSLRVR